MKNCFQVCICLLVRYLPALNESMALNGAAATAAVAAAASGRLPFPITPLDKTLIASTLSIMQSLLKVCSPKGNFH